MLAGIRWSLTSFSQKENVSCKQVIPLWCSTAFLSPFWIIWQLLEPRYYICLNQTSNSDVPVCSKSERSWTNNWAVPKAPTSISAEFWVCSPAYTPSQSVHMQNLIPSLWVQNGARRNKSTLNWASAFCPDSQKCKLQSLLRGLAQFSLCRRWSQKTKLLKMESREGQVLVLSLHLQHIRKEEHAGNSSICNKISSLLRSLGLPFHLDLHFPSKVSHPDFLRCM